MLLTFWTSGLYNATAAAEDHQTGSWWSGNDGVCLTGPLVGQVLPRVPLYQGSFRAFARLHPDGDVMVWKNTYHRDGRHGHGSNHYPGKPSVGHVFFNTLEKGKLDPRLKENELVLGINDDMGLYTVPLPELRKDQGVVTVELGRCPVVVLGLPATHTMGAYRRSMDDATLGFARSGDLFVDDHTGSRWDVEGRCLAGPLAGRRLEPVGFVTLEWLAFSSYHPATPIYKSARDRVIEPVEDPCLRAVADRLVRAGHDVSSQWPVLEAWLPEPALSGLEVVVDGDPLRIFHFTTEVDGEDWVFFRKHGISSGCLAAASFPGEIYQDDTQRVLLPDEKIRWSPLVTGDELGRILDDVRRACTLKHCRPCSLTRFVERMNGAERTVLGQRYLLGAQLPVGAEVGFRLSIGRERWVLLRFPSDAEAAREAERRGHCIRAGRFVLWSDPVGIYVYENLGTRTRPDDEVPWSPLLEDKAFEARVRSALE